jgi:uncharacterized protein YkwD
MNLKNISTVVALVTTTLFFTISVQAASPTFDNDQASTLMSKINGYRTSQGKTALKYSSKLASVAKSRVSAIYSSQSLINSGDPSHNIPGFGSFDAHAKSLGLVPADGGGGIGENFTASTSGVDGSYSNWLKSSSHLANILDDGYAYTAVALSTNLQDVGDPQIPSGISGGVVAIQVFASAETIDGASTPSPAPTPSPTPSDTQNRPAETPAPKPTTTSKPATTTTAKPINQPAPKPKIDKTQKIGAKFKFDDLTVITNKNFS